MKPKHTIQSITGQKIAVHCKDRSEQDAFLKMCEDAGVRWSSGRLPSEEVFNERFTTYRISDDMVLWRASNQIYSDDDFTIIPFTDLLPVHEYKVGDKVVPISKSAGVFTWGDFIGQYQYIQGEPLEVLSISNNGTVYCRYKNSPALFLPSDLTPYIEPVQSEHVETSQPEPLRLKTFNLDEALKNPQDVYYRSGEKVSQWFYFDKSEVIEPIYSVGLKGQINRYGTSGVFVSLTVEDPYDLMLIDRTPVVVKYMNVVVNRGVALYDTIEECHKQRSDNAIAVMKLTIIGKSITTEIVHTYE